MIIPITEITSEQITFILERLYVLNEDYTQLSVDVAVLKNQVSAMTFWTRTIATTFIALMITQIWQLILIKKNGKK